jgi:hypothetical protein
LAIASLAIHTKGTQRKEYQAKKQVFFHQKEVFYANFSQMYA